MDDHVYGRREESIWREMIITTIIINRVMEESKGIQDGKGRLE